MSDGAGEACGTGVAGGNCESGCGAASVAEGGAGAMGVLGAGVAAGAAGADAPFTKCPCIVVKNHSMLPMTTIVGIRRLRSLFPFRVEE